MGQPTPQLFAMTCPHCGIRLKVKSSDIGTKRACPKCSKAIKIGGQGGQPAKSSDDDPPAAKSSQRPQDEFPVVCDCGTRFYANPSQIGTTLDCPDCLTEHKITAPDSSSSRKRLGPSSEERPSHHPAQAVRSPGNTTSNSAPTTDDDDEYQLQPLDDQPKWNAEQAQKPDPSGFHIRCSVCNSSLAVNESMIGKSVKCLDCHSSTMVVKPTFVTKKTKVVARDPKIGVESAHENQKNKEISDRLMSDAHEHQEEIERFKPDPPSAPFAEGIYNYPFLPRVLQGWILLVPLLAIATIMLSEGMKLSESGSMAAIGAVFMFAMAGFLYCLFTLGAGHVLMTLLQSTATGYHQPTEWEGFDMAGWFGRAFYLVCALFYSVLPLVFLTTLAGDFIPAPVRFIGTGTVAFFLFPFFLMSMMDSDSPVVPWSGYVWKTVGKSPGSWFKFYLGTAFVLALSTIPIVAAKYFLGSWGTWLASAFAMIALTIYFRLLGRLAWVLDQLPVDPEEVAEDEEDEAE